MQTLLVKTAIVVAVALGLWALYLHVRLEREICEESGGFYHRGKCFVDGKLME
jgi:hypothetical protein